MNTDEHLNPNEFDVTTMMKIRYRIATAVSQVVASSDPQGKDMQYLCNFLLVKLFNYIVSFCFNWTGGDEVGWSELVPGKNMLYLLHFLLVNIFLTCNRI